MNKIGVGHPFGIITCRFGLKTKPETLATRAWLEELKTKLLTENQFDTFELQPGELVRQPETAFLSPKTLRDYGRKLGFHLIDPKKARALGLQVEGVGDRISEKLKAVHQTPEMQEKMVTVREKSRTPEARQKHSESQKAAWDDPQKSKRIQEGQKKAARDPELRARRRKVVQSPTNRTKASERMKRKWQDPEYREQTLAAQKKALEDPKIRKRFSRKFQRRRQASLQKWANLETRQHMMQGIDKVWKHPEKRKAVLAKMHTPEAHQRLSEAHKRRLQDPKMKKQVDRLHAPEVRQRSLKTTLQIWRNPETHWQRTEAIRQAMKKPEVRENKSKASIVNWRNPEFRQRTIEAIRKTMKQAWQDPAYRERVLTAQRKALQDPKIRKRLSREFQRRRKASLKKWGNPETRQRLTQGINKAWQDPEKRKNMLEKLHSPEAHQRLSEAHKRRLQDPEVLKKHMERLHSPEVRKRVIETMQQMWRTPEIRQRIVQGILESWRDTEKRHKRLERRRQTLAMKPRTPQTHGMVNRKSGEIIPEQDKKALTPLDILISEEASLESRESTVLLGEALKQLKSADPMACYVVCRHFGIPEEAEAESLDLLPEEAETYFQTGMAFLKEVMGASLE